MLLKRSNKVTQCLAFVSFGKIWYADTTRSWCALSTWSYLNPRLPDSLWDLMIRADYQRQSGEPSNGKTIYGRFASYQMPTERFPIDSFVADFWVHYPRTTCFWRSWGIAEAVDGFPRLHSWRRR
jgi:hypothetical protein